MTEAGGRLGGIGRKPQDVNGPRPLPRYSIGVSTPRQLVANPTLDYRQSITNWPSPPTGDRPPTGNAHTRLEASGGLVDNRPENLEAHHRGRGPVGALHSGVWAGAVWTWTEMDPWGAVSDVHSANWPNPGGSNKQQSSLRQLATRTAPGVAPSKGPALPDPLVGVSCTNRAKDRADAQRLVTTRLLDRLHDPLGHFSRLQRIYPRAW